VLVSDVAGPRIVISGKDDSTGAFRSAEHAVESLNGKLETLKGGLEKLGVALSIGEFVEFVHRAVEAAASLGELSERTGISTEKLSQLQYAAKLGGVNSDVLATGIKKLNVSIAEGLAGDAKKVELFKQLHITTKDLGQGTDAVMLKMADGYAHARDGAGKTAVSIGLMGKAGDEMIPFLNKGGTAIRGLMVEADKLGLTISGEFAEKSRDFEDNLTRIRTGSTKLAILLGGDLVEGLGKAMQAFIKAREKGSAFAAMLEGINTLLYGDDRHMADVKIVDITEQILGTMNALDKARSREKSARDVDKADAAANVARLQNRLVGLNKELDMHKNYAKSLDEETAKQKAAAKAAEEARAHGTELTTFVAGQASAYDELSKSLQKQNDLAHAQLEFKDKLPDYIKHETAALSELWSAYTQGKLTLEQLLKLEELVNDTSESEQAAAVRKSEEDDALERAKERQKIRTSEYESSVQLMLQEAGAAHASIANAQTRIDSLKDEMGAEALSAGANISLAEAIERVAIARLQDQQAQKFIEGSEGWSALQIEIDKRKELLGLIHDKAAFDQAKQLWQQFDQTGHDVFVSLFDSSKSALTKIKDLLKTNLIDVLYQITARPWMIQLATSMGVPGAAQAANAGSGSILGNLFSTGSAASSLSGNSAIGGISSAFMGGFNGAGTATSLAAAGGDAMGTAAGTLGAVDSAAASAELGLTATAEATTAATSGIATGIGAGIQAGLAAVPVVGWIALAGMALYSIFGGKGGGPKTEGGYAPGGIDISGIDIGGSVQGSQRGNVSDAKTISDAISTGLTGLGSQFGVSLAEKIGVFFAKDPQGDSLTQLNVVSDNYNRSKTEGGIENVGRSDAEFQAALAKATAQLDLTELAKALSGKIGDYLKAIDPTALTAEQITADIQLAANAKQLTDTFTALGPAFSSVAALSVEGLGDVATAMGGIQKATTDLNTYYANYDDATEQRADAVKRITSTLNAAGLDVTAGQVGSATREQFRQLVEYEVSLGAEGAKAAEALISVNGAFAAISQTTASLSQKLEGSGLLSQSELAKMQATDIQAQLAKSGLNFSADQIMGASVQQVRQLYDGLVQINNLDAANAVLDVSQAFITMKNNAMTATTDMAAFMATGYANEKALRQKAVDDAQAALTTARTNLQTAFDRQVSEIQPLIDHAIASADKLAQVRAGIDLGAQSPLSPAAKFQAAKAALWGASADNAGDLIGGYLDAVKARATSASDLLRMTDQGKEQLSLKEASARLEANNWASQINATRALLQPLLDIKEAITVESGTKAVLDAQAQLAAAQAALGSFVGGNGFATALSDAQIQAQLAMFGRVDGPTSSPTSAPVVQTFAGGGLASGVSLVGERGPELVDFRRPGRVYPARQTAGMFGGGSDAVVQKLAEISSKLDTHGAVLEAIAIHTFQTRKNTKEAIVRGVPALADPATI
jgi:hypothetical protein